MKGALNLLTYLLRSYSLHGAPHTQTSDTYIHHSTWAIKHTMSHRWAINYYNTNTQLSNCDVNNPFLVRKNNFQQLHHTKTQVTIVQ